MTKSNLLFATIYLSSCMLYSAEIQNLTYDKKTYELEYTLIGSDVIEISMYNNENVLVRMLFAGIQKEGKYNVLLFDDAHPAKEKDYIVYLRLGKRAIRDMGFGKGGFIQFGNPSDIEMDVNGDIYIFDQGGSDKNESPLGIYKFKTDGTEICDFYPSQTNFIGLAGSAMGDWLIISDTQLSTCGSANQGKSIMRRDKNGKNLLYIEPQKLGNSKTGATLGKDNKIYLRINATKSYLQLYSNTGNKPVELYSGAVGRPPIVGRYIAPSMKANRSGELYLTQTWNEREWLVKYMDTGMGIQEAYKYSKPFKGAIGFSINQNNMIFVTERGVLKRQDAPSSSRIYQLWDTGSDFSLVNSFDFPEIKGLRDVGVSHDGMNIYLLEDGDDYWGVKGESRLLKYTFQYSQVLKQNIISNN